MFDLQKTALKSFKVRRVHIYRSHLAERTTIDSSPKARDPPRSLWLPGTWRLQAVRRLTLDAIASNKMPRIASAERNLDVKGDPPQTRFHDLWGRMELGAHHWSSAVAIPAMVKTTNAESRGERSRHEGQGVTSELLSSITSDGRALLCLLRPAMVRLTCLRAGRQSMFLGRSCFNALVLHFCPGCFLEMLLSKCQLYRRTARECN